MPSFLIGYSEREFFGQRLTNAWQGRYFGSSWINTEFDTDDSDEVKSYAVFTEASGPVLPPPGGDVISLTAGDVTGDGRAEIIGNFGDGLGTWYWDGTTLSWTKVEPPK